MIYKNVILPKSASIFTGKAYAILHASKVASIKSSPNVAIFSDTMSIIKALPATLKKQQTRNCSENSGKIHRINQQ